MHGAYLSEVGGTVTSVGTITFQGTVYPDGKGGVIKPYTASFNGTIVRVVAPSTHTVASDCTGTMVLGGADYFGMRVGPDDSKSDYIKTDVGAIVSGRATQVQD